MLFTSTLRRHFTINKKINKIFIFHFRFLSLCNFLKTAFCAPYALFMWGTFDTNNLLFLNKLLRDCRESSLSTTSSKSFDELRALNVALAGKRLIVFNFIALLDLKKFVQIISSNLFALNKQNRSNILSIKLQSNILQCKFFNTYFNINIISKRKFVRKIIKNGLYSFKLQYNLSLRLSHYFAYILKIFYFYIILCQLFIK